MNIIQSLDMFQPPFSGGEVLISSRGIAAHFGKRHDNVLRDIADVIANVEEYTGDKVTAVFTRVQKPKNGLSKQEIVGNQCVRRLKSEESVLFYEYSYKNSQGKSQPEYLCTFEAAMLLVTQYDDNLRLALIRRWRQLEATARSWKTARDLSKLEYRQQSTAVFEQRKRQGKPTLHVHYMAEAKLLWYAMQGCFRMLRRDDLSDDELELLATLENMNGSFIRAGLDYAQRKDLLRNYAVQTQALAAAPLLEHLQAVTEDKEIPE